MNFLELLDAYVLAERRYCLTENQRGPGNGPYGPNHPDSIEAAGEAVALRAEIERRLNLAGADHHLAIWRHLNGGEQSRARQRNLLDVAARERRAGIPVERAVQYIEQSIVDEWKAQHP
jgi:hypothetical protein